MAGDLVSPMHGYTDASRRLFELLEGASHGSRYWPPFAMRERFAINGAARAVRREARPLLGRELPVESYAWLGCTVGDLAHRRRRIPGHELTGLDVLTVDVALVTIEHLTDAELRIRTLASSGPIRTPADRARAEALLPGLGRVEGSLLAGRIEAGLAWARAAEAARTIAPPFGH